jgi:hypothetical protein
MDDWIVRQQQQDLIRQQQMQQDLIQQQQVQQNLIQQQQVQQNLVQQQQQQQDLIRQQQQQNMISQQQAQEDLVRQQLDRQRANQEIYISERIANYNPNYQSGPFDVSGSVNRPQEEQERYNQRLQDDLFRQQQMQEEAIRQQQQRQEELGRKQIQGAEHSAEPQVTLSDLTGFGPREREYSRGYLERQFMSEAFKALNTSEHPLHWLIKKDTGSWWSRKKYSFDPTVQAGHLVSRHSGLEERFALEDSTFNQWSSNRGESQGAIFIKDAVDIGGIPVERRTAELWERAGKLPAGTVASAPAHPGWTKRPQDN